MKNSQIEFGVKAIIRKEGYFLILEKPNGQIDLPGGRSNDSDKTVRHALTREIMEETALSIHTNSFSWLSSWVCFNKYRDFIIGHTFLAKYESGPIILSEEHISFKWEEIQNLKTISFKYPYVSLDDGGNSIRNLPFFTQANKNF